MSDPEIDQPRAHRYFAADCFNRAWELLDLPRRDDDQIEEMLHAAHASLWHWLHVPDHTPTHRAIGRWQLARVYAVAGRAGEARHWARRCLETTEAHPVEPFYRAYAHEAAARAERLATGGDPGEGSAADAVARRHLEAARALLQEISDPEDRERLARDLDSLD